MRDLLAFTVVGIVTGSIYATAASGLVVSYTTTGIFNVAHGAVGMVMAFLYWELRFHHHWPAPVALFVVVLVVAPLAGALIERFLMRRLHGVPVATSLVVTIGLTLFLIGLAVNIWKPEARRFPGFFGQSGFQLSSVYVTWHQVTVVALTGLVAVGLRALLFGTRIGVAMRAVVDNRELAELNGTRPALVGVCSWATGSALAALAGILLAPSLSLEALTLTLLVVNAYAAAVVGRLRSLPLTFAGALALGLAQSYAVGYLPLRGLLTALSTSMPTVFLFAVLLILPAKRIRGAVRIGLDSARVPSLRTTLVAAAGLVVVASVLAAALNQRDAIRVGQALGLGTIMLSLVLLTGYSGQVSLCQMTFAGLGAYAMAHAGAGGNPVGLLAAAGLGAAVGALVALPAIRLEGLYLALATMAFALLMDNAFFLRGWVFGQGAAAVVDRVSIFGLSLTSDRSYVVLLAVAFAATAVLVLALRRSGFGRRLAAMKDSPTACTTLGLDLTATKLLVFSISAGIAAVGGALLGGMNQRAGADQFAMFQSLQLLLQVVIGGIASVGGALFGGALNSSFSFVSEHLPKYGAIPFLITGLAGIILGSSPTGIIPRLGQEIRKLRTSRRSPAAPRELWKPRPARAGGVSKVRLELNGDAPPLLELRGVRAGYGRIEVLHGVDLVVPKGKIVAVLGPNGAGKTTALKCVAGHLVPTAGSIRVAGRRVNGAAPDALARAGVCSVREMRGTFPNLTVDDNLRMVSHLAPVEEVRSRAYERFPWLGDRRNQMAGTLSGGEQQMLAMARAVATDPGLLLLDEISMGLAPKIVRELYDVVGTLAADGTTVLVVEQFAQTVLKVADSAVLLVQGAVSCAGTADEVEAALVEGYLGVAS